MNSSLLMNDLALYSLQIGLVVGFTAFVPALVRLRLPGARLAYWHILLCASLLLPLAAPWKQTAIATGAVQVSSAAVVVAPSAPALPRPRFSQGEIALAVLAAGATIRLMWLAVGFWRLRLYRRRAQPLEPALAGGTDDRFLSSVAGSPRETPADHKKRWSAPLAWSVEADLRLSDDVSSPVTFGLRKPMVLLPANFPSLDASVQEAILAHECLHVRRHDWLFMVIEELIRAAFWFHPAIWWLLGEIQLAREQAVDLAAVEMTKGREQYVDALLAIAGARPRLDLAPAPLFLRKRHLKARVLSICKEVRMSKTRLFSALAASVCILAAACWMVAAAFPLAAAPQVVADGPGVSVDLGGAQLMHRTAVSYPPEALAKRVEGTVMVEATLDAAGNVSDARVVSGPDELRKAALTAVLQWHFARDVAGATKIVIITFQAPPGVVGQTGAATINQLASGAEPAMGGAISGAGSALSQTSQETMNQLQASLKNLEAQLSEPGLSEAQIAERKSQLAYQQGRLAGMRAAAIPRKLEAITVDGLPDSLRDQLLASLPVHVGDMVNADALNRAFAAVSQFDEHLSFRSLFYAAGGTALYIYIAAPGAATPVGTTTTDGVQTVKVGGDVRPPRPVKTAPPDYPPLAKAARITGAVVMRATIGTDGMVRDVVPVSGNSMLVPAAVGAVRQWVYEPTMLNGQPVNVSLEITLNFALPNALRAPGPAEVVAPKVLQKVEPRLPEAVRQSNTEGTVVLKIMVGLDGLAHDISAVSGDPMLVQAAIDAVQQWVFQPAMKDGKPVEAVAYVEVNFRL